MEGGPGNFGSVDEALDHFLEVILKAAENTIPLVLPSQKPRVPWWTRDCTEAVRDRKRGLRQFHRTHRPEDYLQYKLFKTRARRTLRQARQKFTNSFLSVLIQGVVKLEEL